MDYVSTNAALPPFFLLQAMNTRCNVCWIAIRIQYPAGMTVTGVPTSHALNNKKQKGKPRWNAWLTHESAGYDDAWDYELDYNDQFDENPAHDGEDTLDYERDAGV